MLVKLHNSNQYVTRIGYYTISLWLVDNFGAIHVEELAVVEMLRPMIS